MDAQPRRMVSVVTALLLILSPGVLRAQGGGGGGGGFGGGGFGGNQVETPRLVQSDVSGPASADSVRSAFALDSSSAAAYADLLKSHLAATAALRDSVGRSAEAAGLARAKIKSTASLEEQTVLGLMLDQLVKRVRKADDEFFDKQVKPRLTKDQYKQYKKWVDRERHPS
ncbi:MAG: hypothetical protein ABJC19_09545 [Gemmatimonadota bacterium]